MMTNIEYIDRYGMLPAGTRVLCALSGGKDSVFLLRLLLEMAPARDLTVGAAHLNHELRGTESDRDETFVKTLCENWGVPLYLERRDTAEYAKAHHLGIEDGARQLRYAFLERVRAQHGYDVIATAHQADDQAETMLLHLARGAGTRGLAGIPPVRGNIIRPILNIPGAEIVRYLSEQGIGYVEDSTNADDTYRRNLVRHRVIPVFTEINPRFVSHAAAAAASLREDDACLQSMAETFLREHYNAGELDAKALTAQPVPIAVRALQSLCGRALTRYHAGEILSLCRGTERKCIMIPGQTVRYEQGKLLFHAEENDIMIEPVPLSGERGTCIAGNYRISWEMGRCTSQIHNSLNTFVLKCENIDEIVFITAKRDGDRFCPVGRNCTKTLKALFQERNMTSRQRALTPVLRDGKGVVAVPGFGMDRRFLAEIGDEVIRISCEEYKEIGG